MKIIFFGLGSIGNRHARILAKNYRHNLFAYRTNEGQGSNALSIKEIYTWDDIKKIKPDIAFITNPTFLHIDTALKCAKLDIRLFIEKPVGSSAKNLDRLLDEVRKRKLVSYVAYCLRFHPVIRFLKRYLESKKINHAAIYASSYLPDWRPQQDYRRSYAASKAKGGGIILEFSHEFDYIEYLFGKIEGIYGISGRASNITLDAEDFADAIVRTNSAYINLHMDLLSMHAERSIKIDCEGEYIFADLLDSRIEFHKGASISVKSFKEGIKDTYKTQMDYFLCNINNDKMMNNLPEASIPFRKILDFRRNSR